MLYGFTLIEKSASTKLFLSAVKGQIDFSTFKPLGKYYARDQHRFYYGPGAKVIKENHLELFHDETYKEQPDWLAPATSSAVKDPAALWKSHVAISESNIYWKGRLAKGVHPSLKRITTWNYADNHSAYDYNLQSLKKIEGVDRSSLIFMNMRGSGSVKSVICDKHQPIHCYSRNSKINKKYDFNSFKPLFETYRDQLSAEYWWYRMERELGTE